MNNNKITLSPYLRLTLAGFDIEVRNHSTKFKVLLKRGAENIAVGEAPRGGGIAAQALEKARLNAWGPTSAFYNVMDRFADIAETLAARQ